MDCPDPSSEFLTKTYVSISVSISVPKWLLCNYLQWEKMAKWRWVLFWFYTRIVSFLRSFLTRSPSTSKLTFVQVPYGAPNRAIEMLPKEVALRKSKIPEAGFGVVSLTFIKKWVLHNFCWNATNLYEMSCGLKPWALYSSHHTV